MIVFPDIVNAEDLKAWLSRRPSEDCAIVAQRAAMRVVPLLWAAMPPPKKHGPSVAPVLRKHLAFDAARRYRRGSSDYEMFADLDAVVDEAAFMSFADHGGIENGEMLEQADTLDSGAPSAFAARIVHRAALAPLFAGDPVEVMWNAVQTDIHALAQDGDALALPLWPWPNPLEVDWQKAQAVLQKMPGGAFWINWYQRLLDGEPQNSALLHDVVLIEDALWAQGGHPLDREIAKTVERHQLLQTNSRLQAEIAALRTSGLAHRGHNQPPELLPGQISELSTPLQEIVEQLEVIGGELGKTQPSPTRLRQIGVLLKSAAIKVLKYCGTLADISLKGTAKRVGETAGVGLVAYLSWKVSDFADALTSFVDKFWNILP